MSGLKNRRSCDDAALEMARLSVLSGAVSAGSKSCYTRHCSATSVVSDSGSETGGASRAHMWPGVVSLTAHSAPTSAYSPHQVRYSNVCAVRDEEAAGSNPATPTTFHQVRDLGH